MWDLSSPTRDWTHVPCIARWILYHWTNREVPQKQCWFTSTRMARIEKSDSNKYWFGSGGIRPFYISGGNAKWCSHFGKQSVPQKVKCTVILWPSSFTPWYIPKKNEVHPHQKLHTNVYSNIVYNSQKVEIIQMSINWWVDKWNETYPYSRILFGH